MSQKYCVTMYSKTCDKGYHLQITHTIWTDLDILQSIRAVRVIRRYMGDPVRMENIFVYSLSFIIEAFT
jgi:hypothetical protein